MNDPITDFSVVEPGDYENLAKFLSEFPTDRLSEEQWMQRLNYWWEGNPAFSGDWIRGYKMVASGAIVGFVGSFPTQMKIGIQEVTVFNGTTWRVQDGFRNESIDLWAYNRRVSKNYISFNTTPTSQVVKLIQKYNYKLYPWGENRQYYYLVNPVEYIKKRYSKLPWKICVLLGKFYSWIQAIRTHNKMIGMKAKVCLEPDSSFDELWEKNKDQFDFTNLRDAKSVAWYAKGKLLVKLMLQNNLVGYAIFYLSIQANTGLKELVMVDLFVDKSVSPTQAVSVLLRDIGSYSAHNGFTVIKFPCFSAALKRALSDIGLHSKEMETNGFVRIPKDWAQIETYNNPYLTLLQGDWGSFGQSEIS
jgi:hypothetical protein